MEEADPIIENNGNNDAENGVRAFGLLDDDDDDDDENDEMEEDFDDEEEEEEDDGYGAIILEKTVRWVDTTEGTTYTIKVTVSNSYAGSEAYEVDGSITFHPGEQAITGVVALDRLIHSFVAESDKIGFLRGYLLERPNADLYGLADELNSEALNLCTTFCNPDGAAIRVDHPQLPIRSANELAARRHRNSDQKSGSLFHIYEVGIHPDFSGKDLGIRMIREALDFLVKDYAANDVVDDDTNDDDDDYDDDEVNDEAKWTLAVVVPMPSGSGWRYGAADKSREKPHYWYPPLGSKAVIDDDDDDDDDEPKDDGGFAAAHKKICIQFARLGFEQASRTPGACHAWFMTRTMLQNNGVNTNNNTAGETTRWLKKDQVATTIDIFKEPKPQKMSEIDKQLNQLVVESNRAFENCMERIKTLTKDSLDQAASLRDQLNHFEMLREWGVREGAELPEDLESQLQQEQQRINRIIERSEQSCSEMLTELRNEVRTNVRLGIENSVVAEGASLDRALALHFCASNSVNGDTTMCEILVDLGATVNLADHSGATPLHLAACLARPHIIAYLISQGADPNIRDICNHTAMDCFRATYQEKKDQRTLLGTRLPPHESDVVPMFESAKALMTQAQRDALKDGLVPPSMMPTLASVVDAQLFSLSAFEHLGNLDLDMCYTHWSGISFIPPDEVILDYEPQSEYWRIFMSGYRSIWTALRDLIRNGRAPTFDSARQRLSQNQQGALNWSGVKIEYALDCLFAIAKGRNLPSALPLDDMYDEIWFMCIHRGGSAWPRNMYRGPHEHEWGHHRVLHMRLQNFALVPVGE